MRSIRTAMVLLLVWAVSSLAATSELDTARIDQLTGLHGKLDGKQRVYKVFAPRSDLKVTVGSVHLTPPLGLTSWAAFMRRGKSAMVMGDLVLREDQVSPVMSAALDHGLEVTALHNHFLGESPVVMFMHVGGMGEEADLARAIGTVLATIRETAEHPVTAFAPPSPPPRRRQPAERRQCRAAAGRCGMTSTHAVTKARSTSEAA